MAQRLDVIVGLPTHHPAAFVLVLAIFGPIVRPHETTSGHEFGCLVHFGIIAGFPVDLTTYARMILPILVKNTRDRLAAWVSAERNGGDICLSTTR